MKINHLIVTRSAYSKNTPRDVLERRLELTREIHVMSLAAQGNQNFRCVVLADSEDPLILDRKAAYVDAGINPTIVFGREWIDSVSSKADITIATRIDDDDAIATDFVDKVQNECLTWFAHSERPCVVVFPDGWMWNTVSFSQRNYLMNQFCSAACKGGIAKDIYSVPHTEAWKLGTVIRAGGQYNWLWTIHDNSLSGSHKKNKSFPLDVQKSAFGIQDAFTHTKEEQVELSEED